MTVSMAGPISPVQQTPRSNLDTAGYVGFPSSSLLYLLFGDPNTPHTSTSTSSFKLPFNPTEHVFRDRRPLPHALSTCVPFVYPIVKNVRKTEVDAAEQKLLELSRWLVELYPECCSVQVGKE